MTILAGLFRRSTEANEKQKYCSSMITLAHTEADRPWKQLPGSSFRQSNLPQNYPDFVLSDCWMFGNIYESLQGQHFCCHGGSTDSCLAWMQYTQKQSIANGLKRLPHCWKGAWILRGICWDAALGKPVFIVQMHVNEKLTRHFDSPCINIYWHILPFLKILMTLPSGIQ